ncbi:hypothetical protein ABZ464_19010 [Streptomyces sp. NPDC005820]|uniref:hypothetical protein n=1 Tax=Streptomyces sp. NPDC005820 TaxID=3157069 RepID=UPI0033D2DF41
MLRTRTHEQDVVRALRDGDVEAVENWIRTVLPTVVTGELPAPVVRHPLEFVCVPLRRDGELGLCMHVWPQDEEDSSPVVHAHSWDLWSYVLCGTVFNDVMHVRDDSAAPEFGLFAVTSTSRGDEFRATGRLVTCEPSERQEIAAGQVYRLASGRFHRSGHRGFTATLVLGEHREGLDSLVLAPPGGHPSPPRPRERCAPDEVRHLMTRIDTERRRESGMDR